jgi:hypothetical protein
MIYLSGDVGALMGAIFLIALMASLVFTVILKFILKDRLKLYWYFLISLGILTFLFILLFKFPDFFF